MSGDQAKTAFERLLAQPLLTGAAHPEEHAAVMRHRGQVTEIARRFGYRVRPVGTAVRLERVPLAGTVEHPPAPVDVPSRRILVLACLVAAACEDTDGAATLAELSAGVAVLTAGAAPTPHLPMLGYTSPEPSPAEATGAPMKTAPPPAGIGHYDPDSAVHRRLLVKAVNLLASHGVLTLRTGAAAIDAWQESRTGAGAGYQVNRDALFLLTSGDILALAVTQPSAEDRAASRTQRLRRTLLEKPALVYADLAEVDEEDAAAARNQRGFLKGPVTDAVRGHVEDRAEGMVLVVGDSAAPSPLAIDFPAARTDSWAALLAADAAGQVGTRDPATGRVHLTAAQVTSVIAELIEDRGDYLRQDLRDNPSAVRAAVDIQLRALDLLRLDGDGWVLSPVAGRYRAPEVIKTAPAVEDQP